MADRLAEIEAHMEDLCDRWNILLAQADRVFLWTEVKRLQTELEKAQSDRNTPVRNDREAEPNPTSLAAAAN